MSIKTNKVFCTISLVLSLFFLTSCATSQTRDTETISLNATLNAEMVLNLMPGDTETHQQHSLVVLESTQDLQTIEPLSCEIYYNGTLIAQSSTFERSDNNDYIVQIDLSFLTDANNKVIERDYDVVFTFRKAGIVYTLTTRNPTISVTE